jgi:Rieske Fe-S protein
MAEIQNGHDGRKDGRPAITNDPAANVDPLLSTPGREGLTGVTPSALDDRPCVREQITIPPDGRPLESQPQWRKDFPIDWPQDQHVARRDFTKFVVLTSFAFVAGHVSIGAQSLLRGHEETPAPRKVANLADVPVGSSIVFQYPTPHDPCLLIRLTADTLLAYSQSCTHLSCAVVPRIQDNCIHCPCHEGYFDLQSGRPIAGPPRRPLPKIRIEVRQGEVYATGVERSMT